MMLAMISTLGSRLRAERKAKGWTLAELAQRSGVSAGMISDLEHERSHGSTRLHAIAAALGVATPYLAAGIGHKDAGVASSTVKYHGYQLSPEAAELAAEWEKLEEPLRQSVLDFVEILVAKQVKKRRKSASDPARPIRREP